MAGKAKHEPKNSLDQLKEYTIVVRVQLSLLCLLFIKNDCTHSNPYLIALTLIGC